MSAKRVAVLSLTLTDYRRWADQVEKGFLLAAKFLRKECLAVETRIANHLEDLLAWIDDAGEIIENLEAGLNSFREVLAGVDRRLMTGSSWLLGWPPAVVGACEYRDTNGAHSILARTGWSVLNDHPVCAFRGRFAAFS